jgi:hypothetical protein
LGDSVSINVNDDDEYYFQTEKCLWQGDLFSPLLFSVIADMPAILVYKAREDGKVSVVPHPIDGGLSILQYVDDTVMFMEHDMDKAKKVKLLLCIF